MKTSLVKKNAEAVAKGDFSSYQFDTSGYVRLSLKSATDQHSSKIVTAKERKPQKSKTK